MKGDLIIVTEDKIEDLLKSGDKLAAIQVLVKEEGFSLKDAKDYVEQYQLEYGMEQATNNEHNEPLEKQNKGSWFLFFVIFAFVFLILVFMTAPIISTNTKILQGFSGVCFWMFLHGRMILVSFIVSCCFLWRIFKVPHKAKAFGAFLVTLVFLFIFINTGGVEVVDAVKDLVSEPVEVSFADYEVEDVYMTTGRSGSSRICFRVVPKNYQGVNSILMPRKSLENILSGMPLHEPDIDAMRKEQGIITVLVYPNTGIVANRKSLETLRENIIIY